MAKQKDENDIILTADNNPGNMIGENNGQIVIKKDEYNFNGMGYSDVRALCLDLIKDELAKTKQAALEIAKQRDEKLVSKILEQISICNITPETLIKSLEEPSLQIDFVEAEKSYIKYGSDELLDILSNVIVKRIQESKFSLLQIALSESIKTAPLLLNTQMNTLALTFVMNHTYNQNVNSLDTLKTYFSNTIIPIYLSGVCKKKSEFQHLTYTRCATSSEFYETFISLVAERYITLFSTGFTEDEIPIDEDTGKKLSELYPELFVPCLNDKLKFQINAMNSRMLEKRINLQNLEHKKQIEKLLTVHRLDEKIIKQKIINLCPKMEEIISYWDENGISHLQLSSVGIVLGAITANKITNKDYDLNSWI